jgi:hypothetical protein
MKHPAMAKFRLVEAQRFHDLFTFIRASQQTGSLCFRRHRPRPLMGKAHTVAGRAQPFLIP